MLTEVQIIKENTSVESSAMTGAPERVRPGKGPMWVAALHSEDETTAVTTGAVAAPRGTQYHHVIPDNELMQYPWSCIGRLEATPKGSSNWQLAGTIDGQKRKNL